MKSFIIYTNIDDQILYLCKFTYFNDSKVIHYLSPDEGNICVYENENNAKKDAINYSAHFKINLSTNEYYI